MAKKPQKTKLETAQSSPPEKFEAFAERMEAESSAALSSNVRPIVEMEKKMWSGVPMWQCPRCHATVWSEPQSIGHTCKEVRYVDEEFTD